MKTLMLSTLAVLTLAGAASSQEVTLRLHHFLSADSHVHADILVPWEKAVEDQSNGRIDVQIFPSMQLGGKPPQLYDQARDGVVDISWTLLGYSPGRFPISEVFELPFMSGSAAETTAALQEFQAKYLADELKDVHPLVIHGSTPYKFHTKSVQITSMADLKGLKIRTPSRAMTDGLAALGATAIGMPVPEVAQAVTTGVIDGALLPWEVFGSLRMEDLTKNHTEFAVENGGLSASIMALVMNKPKYEALPDDLKKVIDDNSGLALAEIAGKALDAGELVERQKALDAGGQIVVIPEADLAEWRTASQPVIEAWIKTMTDAGHDGHAIVDDATAMLAKAQAQ